MSKPDSEIVKYSNATTEPAVGPTAPSRPLHSVILLAALVFGLASPIPAYSLYFSHHRQRLIDWDGRDIAIGRIASPFIFNLAVVVAAKMVVPDGTWIRSLTHQFKPGGDDVVNAHAIADAPFDAIKQAPKYPEMESAKNRHRAAASASATMPGGRPPNF